MRKAQLKNQRGVALITELMVVLMIVPVLLALYSERDQNQRIEESAAEIGARLAQYNSAVQRWIAFNPGTVNTTQNGVAWLKPTTCGGGVGRGVTRLSRPIADKPPQYCGAFAAGMAVAAISQRSSLASPVSGMFAGYTPNPGQIMAANNGDQRARSDIASMAGHVYGEDVVIGRAHPPGGRRPRASQAVYEVRNDQCIEADTPQFRKHAGFRIASQLSDNKAYETHHAVRNINYLRPHAISSGSPASRWQIRTAMMDENGSWRWMAPDQVERLVIVKYP